VFEVRFFLVFVLLGLRAVDPLRPFIYVRMTAAAARAARAVEVGSQELSRLQGGVNGGVQSRLVAIGFWLGHGCDFGGQCLNPPL